MPNQDNSIFFIIDGNALVYRSYYAFSQNNFVTSYGLNTSAIYGFTTILFDLIKREKPQYLAIAFDTPKPTWRHKEFSKYKSTRPKQPETITISLPYIKKILDALRIKHYELAGYEADDIVGTITNELKNKNINIYMMTPDKDYAQLVNEHTFIYKPTQHGYNILGITQVVEKWGISNVDQVKDFLALQGDKSDNIPGINGIGPKTAQKLLKKYGSLENIIKNTDNLPDKIKHNFTDIDQICLSKKLATISTNVPINFNIEECYFSGYDRQKTLDIFTELEFLSLIKRYKIQ